MSFRRGQWVRLPSGAPGIVYHVGGSGHLPTAGSPDVLARYQGVPAGSYVLHQVNPDGTTLMVPNEKTLRFETKELTLTDSELKQLPVEEIPAARRSA